MTGHRQVSLTGPAGRPVEVDRGVARLVAAVWRAGATTGESCQGGGADYAYVVGDRRMLDMMLAACGTIADDGEPEGPPIMAVALAADWWMVEVAPDDVDPLAAAIGTTMPRRRLVVERPAL